MKKIFSIFILLAVVITICYIADTPVDAGQKIPCRVQNLCKLADQYTDKYRISGRSKEKWPLIALKLSMEAWTLDKNSALPHISMANTYIEMNNIPEAVKSAKRAARFDSDNRKIMELFKTLGIRKQEKKFFTVEAADKYLAVYKEDGDLKILYNKYKEFIIGGLVIAIIIIIVFFIIFFRIVYRPMRFLVRMFLRPFRRRN